MPILTDPIRRALDDIDAWTDQVTGDLAAANAKIESQLNQLATANVTIQQQAARIAELEGTTNPPEPPPTAYDHYIAPDGTGDGASEATAAAFSTIPAAIAAGKRRIALIADRGPYQVGPVTIINGGTPDAPVVISGLRGYATCVGTRNSGAPDFDSKRDIGDGTTIWQRPWKYLPTPENWQPINAASWGSQGNELFRLGNGANHITIRFIDAVRRIRVVNLVGQVTDIVVEDCKFYNIDSFCYMAHTGTAKCERVTLRRITGQGCSSEFVRWRGSSKTLRVHHVVCDSAWQTGGKFFMGIFCLDTASDIVVEDTTMMNGLEPNGFDDTNYAQGDGFVAEKGVTGVVFRRCTAVGMADGGFDFKAVGTLVEDCESIGCKNSFRTWNAAKFVRCRSTTPHKLAIKNKDYAGGSGGVHDLEVIGGMSESDKTIIEIVDCPTFTRVHKAVHSGASAFFGEIKIQDA